MSPIFTKKAPYRVLFDFQQIIIMIFSMLSFLFKNHNKCKHKKVTPFSTGSFCPDCGEEIKISWIILRCSCCQSKRHTRVAFNSLFPRDKFCIKCGDSAYYTEKKETIDYFEVEYAVISKQEINENIGIREILQVWIENERNSADILNNLKLIPVLY